MPLVRHRLLRPLFAVALGAAALAGGCGSNDTAGGAAHDAGADHYATQICQCCGTQVTIPADDSCGRGACDGLCNRPTKDASTDVEAGSCSYPPAHNDPLCPATYEGAAKFGKPCAPVGLECAYPGEGDPGPSNGSGCDNATAMMWCRASIDASADGGGDLDSGGDAGEGTWMAAQ